MKKIALVAAAVLGLAAIVVPSLAAKPPAHPAHPAHPAPKAPHCVAHSVSYEVWGKLTATGSLTANADGTYTGTLTVLVSRTNHHAKGDRHQTKTYTLTNAHVKFSHGVSTTAPAANSKVHLKGTITTEPKKCTGFTPTTTITRAELHAAKH